MATLRTNDKQKELLRTRGYFYILRANEPEYEDRDVTVRTVGPCRLEYVDRIKDSLHIIRVARGSGYDTWKNWRKHLSPKIRDSKKQLLLYRVVKT